MQQPQRPHFPPGPITYEQAISLAKYAFDQTYDNDISGNFRLTENPNTMTNIPYDIITTEEWDRLRLIVDEYRRKFREIIGDDYARCCEALFMREGIDTRNHETVNCVTRDFSYKIRYQNDNSAIASFFTYMYQDDYEWKEMTEEYQLAELELIRRALNRNRHNI